jgi:ubiquinone/menaquinone biosynthesis C-methylase UbiE
LTEKHCLVSRNFVEALGRHAAVAQADARSLPYPSSSFDLAYSFGVLLLVPDLDRAVQEIHRVLKPGGRVAVMFYNRQSIHYLLKTRYYFGKVCDLEELLGPRRLVDWFTDGFGYPRTYHQTPDTLRRAFDRFEIESLVVRNLTPDQFPLFPFDEYPAEFWSWLAGCVGFYLLLKGRK